MPQLGLTPHTNLSDQLGSAAPAVWRIHDADLNAFAVGDVVVDSLGNAGGMPVAALSGRLPPPTSPARTTSLLQSLNNAFGVIVAVGPASILDAVQPVIAAGGGTSRFVWVLPAAGHVFDIYGDSALPARLELPSSGSPPYMLSAEMVNKGDLTASLNYAPPAGARSGTTLAGASISSNSRGELVVVGLAPGVPLAAHALYRVKLQTAPSFVPAYIGNPVQSRPSPDGM